MKKLTKNPVLWLCCTLLFLPFLVAGPSSAQCNMTSGQLDAELASCDDLDCFVDKAKNNVPCAANIAWYYMIMYAPENPTHVRNSFMNALPYSYALQEKLTTSIDAAYLANKNEQQAGSKTSANEYPSGQGSRSGEEQPYGQ